MSKPIQPVAPTCIRCGRIYLEGVGGVCSACRQASRRNRTLSYKKRKYHHKLTCDCGRPADTVLLVTVGSDPDGLQTVRMPLCRQCLELERRMWDELDSKLDKVR